MIWWFSKIGISVLGENMWLQLGEMCHWQRAAWKNSKINNINIPTFSAQPALRLCFLRKCHDFFYTFFPCNYFIFAQRPGPHETVETVAPVAVRCARVNRVYATCNVSILCQYYATLTHTGKNNNICSSAIADIFFFNVLYFVWHLVFFQIILKLQLRGGCI